MQVPDRDTLLEENHMFTRKTFFAAATMVTLAAGLGAPAFAQHGGPEGGPGGWHHGGPFLEGITLTDDQKTKLHALMKSEHQNNSLFRQLHAVHEQIDSAIFSTASVSEATLQPLLQQETSLMQQVEAQRVSNQLAIRNMLTADQLATASATHAKLVSLHEQEHALMKSNTDSPPAGPDQAD